RAATLLAGSAAAGAAWGIGTAIGLARLGTGLAVRASAELAGYAGQALSGPMRLDRWVVLRIDDGKVTEVWGRLAAQPEPDPGSGPDSSRRDDAGAPPRWHRAPDGASGPDARNAAGPEQNVEEGSADGR
ncbi:MAG TPA: hypothetical protein VFE03_06170, partial [Caulobacteraceae bacterium]|nr:hypothetical protein [Caulobacteraceae bacterium]